MKEKDNYELLEIFRRMSPENRANILAYVRVAYSAQETIKRQYGLDQEQPAQQEAQSVGVA
jgi:hypothetical protein